MLIAFTQANIVSQTTFFEDHEKRKQILDLIEQAKLADEKLHEFMRMLSNRVNNESGKPINYVSTSIKKRDRVAEKCGIPDWDDPSKDKPSARKPVQVKDIARATIEFSTIAQMLAFRNYIYETPEFQVLAKKDTPAVKDLWSKGVEDAYKDIKFFLQVEISYTPRKGHKKVTVPHIVELQLNGAQMAFGKRFGHAFYNLSRLAFIDGSQCFLWDDPDCVITVPGKIKGKVCTKLRTALTHCKSLACGDPEILLAVNILTKMLHSKKIRLPTKEEKEELPVSEHLDYANGTVPLTIRCGPYDFKKGGQLDSDPAQAWAIARLSSFVWAHFTKSQNKPGITGTAANWHAKG